MAILHPKIPNVMVNTGGNHPFAWRNAHKLQCKRIKIIVLSSWVQGYPTYYEYIRKNRLMPFYVSCCDKAKERHLDRFYNTIPGPVTVNIGFCVGEDKRAMRLSKKDTSKRVFNYPMLRYTREECEKILRANNMDIIPGGSGCWFCPKQPHPPEWAVRNIIKTGVGGG